MRVSVEEAGGLTRKLTVAVPSASFEEKIEARVRKAAGDLKLPGFRPGHVPLSEVRRRFGQQLRQEVASELLQSSLSEAVQQQELAVAGRAAVEDLRADPGADFEFTATFEVLPEVEITDLAKLRIRKPDVAIDDADVEAMVQTLREQHTQWHEVERPVAFGDRLVADLAVSEDDEVIRRSEGQTLAVDSTATAEFRDAVIGLGVGETCMLRPDTQSDGAAGEDAIASGEDVAPVEGAAELQPAAESDAATEPDAAAETETAAEPDAADESAQETGLEVQPRTLHFTVRRVEEPTVPEVDDAFFDALGIAEPEEDQSRRDRFLKDVRERMAVDLAAKLRRRMRDEVFLALRQTHDFDVPAALIEARADAAHQELEQSLGKVPTQLEVLVEHSAEMQAREELLLRALVQSASLALDDARVRDLIDEIASAYEETAQVKNYLYGDERQLASIERTVLEQQAVEHVLERARVEEMPLSYADTMADVALPELPPEEEPVADEAEAGAALDAATAAEAPAAEPAEPQAKRGGFMSRLFGKR